PLTPSVVRRASFVFVVIQASGVAARAGAASAKATTTASKPCFTQYVPFIIFLLCPLETLWSLKSAELMSPTVLRVGLTGTVSAQRCPKNLNHASDNPSGQTTKQEQKQDDQQYQPHNK